MSDYALTQALLDSVTANLPSMVGTQLKMRLQQADKDADSVVDLQKKLEAALQRATSAEGVATAQANRLTDIEKRESRLIEGETKLAVKTAVLEVREAAAKEKVEYSLQALGAIFRERSLMWNLTGNIPFPNPGSSYPTNQSFSASGDVSGR